MILGVEEGKEETTIDNKRLSAEGPPFVGCGISRGMREASESWPALNLWKCSCCVSYG